MQILEQAQASSSGCKYIGTRTRQVSGAPREVVAVGSGRVPGLPPEPEAPPGPTCPGLDDTRTEGQRAQAAKYSHDWERFLGSLPRDSSRELGCEAHLPQAERRDFLLQGRADPKRFLHFVVGCGVPPDPCVKVSPPPNLRWELNGKQSPRRCRKEGGPQSDLTGVLINTGNLDTDMHGEGHVTLE